MQELYDDTYRIVDHNTPEPMSWIGYSEQEDPVVMAGIEKYMDEYLSAEINTTMGLSYDEWMSKQYWERKLIVKTSIRYLEKKAKADENGMNNVTKDMNNLLKNLK